MDVVTCDLATSVAMHELQLCTRYGAMGIKYLTNIDDASRVEIGVDKLLYLPQDSDLRVTSPGGSLTEIIESIRFFVEATLNNNHIRAKYARNDSGNAPSAASLQILELESTNNNIAMTEDTWRPWESRRYEVDRRILQVEANADPGPEYSVDFLEPNYAVTPESEIQLWDWRLKNGLATKKMWFMYNNPDYNEDDLREFEEMQAEQEPQQPENRLLNRLQS